MLSPQATSTSGRIVGNIPMEDGRLPQPRPQQPQQLIFDVNKFFAEYNNSTVPVNSYYPILQKRLAGGMSNLRIEGTMRTNYTGVVGSSATHGYSLIQVGKASSGLANALGGYGVAWKPLVGSPADTSAHDVTLIKKVGTGQYEITLSSPYPSEPQVGFAQSSGYLQLPYRSTSTYVFVSVQFLDYKSDGSTIRCLSGNTELLDSLTGYTNVALYLVRPNVFIIDYTSSVNDINLWDNLSDEMGFLSFLNCGVANIQPNLDYDFTLAITEDNGIEFSIDDPAFSVSAPARIPLYEYVAADDTDSVGISVYGTDGFKWYYDNIRISSMAEQYPYLYCQFSTEGLREDIYIKTTARGFKGEGVEAGMKIFVCTSAGEWEMIGYNTGETMQSVVSDVIKREDYTFRQKINIIIMGMTPGDAEGNSSLEVDTVSVENSESIATHIGGFIDSYIDAPCVVKTYDLVPNADTGTLYINNSTEGIVHIIGLTRDGLTLAPSIDYVAGLDEFSYTCRGSLTIATRYRDGIISLAALTCPALVTIFSSMVSRNIRPTGYDLLVKHRIVHYLDVIGSNRATVLPHLVKYVQTLPRVDGVMQFSYAQFIFYLLQNKITTSGVYITDSYYSDGIIKKDYLRNTRDTIDINKISCIRVSSGQ
jgi:hypothetical protein